MGSLSISQTMLPRLRPTASWALVLCFLLIFVDSSSRAPRGSKRGTATNPSSEIVQILSGAQRQVEQNEERASSIAIHFNSATVLLTVKRNDSFIGNNTTTIDDDKHRIPDDYSVIKVSSSNTRLLSSTEMGGGKSTIIKGRNYLLSLVGMKADCSAARNIILGIEEAMRKEEGANLPIAVNAPTSVDSVLSNHVIASGGSNFDSARTANGTAATKTVVLFPPSDDLKTSNDLPSNVEQGVSSIGRLALNLADDVHSKNLVYRRRPLVFNALIVDTTPAHDTIEGSSDRSIEGRRDRMRTRGGGGGVFKVDVSGNFFKCSAVCVGVHAEKVNQWLSTRGVYIASKLRTLQREREQQQHQQQQQQRQQQELEQQRRQGRNQSGSTESGGSSRPSPHEEQDRDLRAADAASNSPQYVQGGERKSEREHDGNTTRNGSELDALTGDGGDLQCCLSLASHCLVETIGCTALQSRELEVELATFHFDEVDGKHIQLGPTFVPGEVFIITRAGDSTSSSSTTETKESTDSTAVPHESTNSSASSSALLSSSRNSAIAPVSCTSASPSSGVSAGSKLYDWWRDEVLARNVRLRRNTAHFRWRRVLLR